VRRPIGHGGAGSAWVMYRPRTVPNGTSHTPTEERCHVRHFNTYHRRQAVSLWHSPGQPRSAARARLAAAARAAHAHESPIGSGRTPRACPRSLPCSACSRSPRRNGSPTAHPARGPDARSSPREMRQGLAHLAAGTIAAMVAQQNVPVPLSATLRPLNHPPDVARAGRAAPDAHPRATSLSSTRCAAEAVPAHFVAGQNSRHSADSDWPTGSSARRPPPAAAADRIGRPAGRSASNRRADR